MCGTRRVNGKKTSLWKGAARVNARIGKGLEGPRNKKGARTIQNRKRRGLGPYESRGEKRGTIRERSVSRKNYRPGSYELK